MDPDGEESTASEGESEEDEVIEARKMKYALAKESTIDKSESLLNESENVDPDKKTTTGTNADDYSKYVEYNSDGVAIYTDPKTNFKYKWSPEKNSWLAENENAPQIPLATNDPYENEHYRWCTEKNQWIPKQVKESTNREEPDSNDDGGGKNVELENEFYKWDKTKNQWIPKITSSSTMSNETNFNCDYVDGEHVYTDKDGVKFFWDTEKKAWFPKIDDDFMAIYQMNYGFIDNTTKTSDDNSDETSVASMSSKTTTDDKSEILEKLDSDDKSKNIPSGVKRKAPPEPPKWFDIAPEQNTKVYVSNLPLDITEEEFTDIMKKCGMIMRDPQTQKTKIKLYTDSNGMLKGDALCDYIKVESVQLAINILDGSDVRGKQINVQRAKFQMRGNYNPALKPKRKKKDKEKLAKLKEKLFDWRPEKMRGERSKHERVVIIKNLFTPELFDANVALILEYQKDLREECSKCGTVRKVIVYDRHADGVAQISMADPEQADVVVQMMNGRYFGQRKLTAELWDGKTKYKVDETADETQSRLNKWDEFLDSEDEDANDKDDKTTDDKKLKDPKESKKAEKIESSVENVTDDETVSTVRQ